MGGSLKFKGDAPKKKKSKSSSKEPSMIKDSKAAESDQQQQQQAGTSSSSSKAKSSKDKDDPIATAFDSLPETGKTDAEKRYDKERLKRLSKWAEKEAPYSHKDRVAALNDKLERMSEHHDIPKVGPG